MNQCEYSVGDVVEIREASFLKTQRHVYPGCVDRMYKYAGMKASITRVMEENSRYSEGVKFTYKLTVDDGGFCWNGDWFVGVSDKVDNEVLKSFDELL